MVVDPERKHFDSVVVDSEPELILKSFGWYIVPLSYDDQDRPEILQWHLAHQWVTEQHTKMPCWMWGIPSVIEFCQGEAALTGRGRGGIDWHGPFPFPMLDYSDRSDICEKCQEIWERMEKSA